MLGVVTQIHNRSSNRGHIYVREWRKHRGLTQERVAERLGTTKGVVSQLENGKRQITTSWMFGLAEALNIEPDQLFRHPEQPTIADLLRMIPPEERQYIEGLVTRLAKAS